MKRLSLDCLDGRHEACAVCGCPCHPLMLWRPAPIRDHVLAALGVVVGMLGLGLLVVAWVVFS